MKILSLALLFLCLALTTLGTVWENGLPYEPIPVPVLATIRWSIDPLARPRPTGYNVHIGTVPGVYPVVYDVGDKYGVILQLMEGFKYYVQIVGYNEDHLEGIPPKEYAFTIPITTSFTPVLPGPSPNPTPVAPSGIYLSLK